MQRWASSTPSAIASARSRAITKNRADQGDELAIQSIARNQAQKKARHARLALAAKAATVVAQATSAAEAAVAAADTFHRLALQPLPPAEPPTPPADTENEDDMHVSALQHAHDVHTPHAACTPLIFADGKKRNFSDSLACNSAPGAARMLASI